MREIKFRAYSGLNHKMIRGYPVIIKGVFDRFVEDITGSNYGTESWQLDLMQFTGLLDKNGKEIYEGDIVKYYEYGEEHTMVVSYDPPQFWPLGKIDDCCNGFSDSNYGENSRYGFEVIGNKHENPEMYK